MVKGKTKSGLKFQIDESIKNDTRLFQYLTELQSTDRNKQSVALFDMLNLVFGGRDNVIAFQNAIANAHDGVCTAEVMMQELEEIFGALEIKKS